MNSPVKTTTIDPTVLRRANGVTPHYIGYLRVSKERDATGSYTFETQRKRILESLNRRFGENSYDITFFEDDGLSGGFGLNPTALQSKVRPTLRQIADMVATGDFAGVVVYGQNRLFRNTRGLMELVEDVLLANEVPLLSATEEIDIFTSEGRMHLFMKGLFDQKQREDVIQRNRDAAATRAEEGYPVGQVGYGWTPESRSEEERGGRRGIVPVEEEKQWVVHIKDRYLSGWNTIRIAGELNDLAVPSPLRRKLWTSKAHKQRTRDGQEPRWTKSTVWNVLRNPLHAGLIKLRDGQMIQGRHWEHRFWEPEVLQEIEQAHKERNKRFKTATGAKNQEHLLAGLIYCARCGNRLYMASTSQTTKNYRSYKCFNGQKEGQPTCPDMVVRADWVEEAVIEEVSRIGQEPLMRRLLREEVASATENQDEQLLREKTQLTRKLSQLDQQFDKWAESYSRGIMSDSQFQKFNAKLTAEQEEASVRLKEVEVALENRQQREAWAHQVQDQLLNFAEVWAELDKDEKRNLLALLIEDKRLTVNREGRDIRMQIKIHLLPEQERPIIYRTYQGKSRTKASGLQQLTLRQMVLLYHSGRGKDRKQCAQEMGCKVESIYTIEKSIRKKLGRVTWDEAIAISRERVETLAAANQLPFDSAGRASSKAAEPGSGQVPLLSPVLQEVFDLFAKGAKVPEVANELDLSVTTVQGRKARILKLFGTSSIYEAVKRANQHSN